MGWEEGREMQGGREIEASGDRSVSLAPPGGRLCAVVGGAQGRGGPCSACSEPVLIVARLNLARPINPISANWVGDVLVRVGNRAWNGWAVRT